MNHGRRGTRRNEWLFYSVSSVCSVADLLEPGADATAASIAPLMSIADSPPTVRCARNSRLPAGPTMGEAMTSCTP